MAFDLWGVVWASGRGKRSRQTAKEVVGQARIVKNSSWQRALIHRWLVLEDVRGIFRENAK
jgi:hypothetical protein